MAWAAIQWRRAVVGGGEWWFFLHGCLRWSKSESFAAIESQANSQKFKVKTSSKS